jgi:predicted alpha/beta-fold hydrolase
MIATDAFVPRPSLRGGHWMTLYGWGNPRYFPNLPPPIVRYFDVEPEARVLAHCHWQPRPWERPTIILLHGLNGSSDAHYMKGIAAKAFARGMNAIRLNQRNCGGHRASVGRAVSLRTDRRCETPD